MVVLFKGLGVLCGCASVDAGAVDVGAEADSGTLCGPSTGVTTASVWGASAWGDETSTSGSLCSGGVFCVGGDEVVEARVIELN